MKEIVLTTLIAAIVAAVLVRKWYRAREFKVASEMAKEVFPVWAAQGPFASGEQSAKALRYSHMAVSGPDLSEKMLEGIAQHAIAYDEDPETREHNREETLQYVTEETRDYVEAAIAFAALDQLKDGLLYPLEKTKGCTER